MPYRSDLIRLTPVQVIGGFKSSEVPPGPSQHWAGGSPHYCAASATSAASSAAGMEPAGRRSRAKVLATRWSTSFTGVGTPCSRPSRAISPLRKSASIVPVPRLRLCQEEPPPRGRPRPAAG